MVEDPHDVEQVDYPQEELPLNSAMMQQPLYHLLLQSLIK
jgi:hypothetical protein